jgi:metal-sulfur cluster biosynthetic enzyme
VAIRRRSIPTCGLVFPLIGATLRASRRDPAAPSRAIHDRPATHHRNTTDPAAVSAFELERRAKEIAILDALREVVDPEIGMNVVELALIKQVILGETESEVKMILTTPFCPYAGSMIAQVKEQAESVLDHPVKVTLLAERWDPRDAGLMW